MNKKIRIKFAAALRDIWRRALEPIGLLPWFQGMGEKPQLINMYGITETTVHVTYYQLLKMMCSFKVILESGFPI